MAYTFPNPAQQEQNRPRSSTRRRGDAEISAEKTRTRWAGRAGFAAFLRRAEPAESAEEKPSGVGSVCPRLKRLFPDIFSNLFGLLDFTFEHHGRGARNAAVLAHP